MNNATQTIPTKMYFLAYLFCLTLLAAGAISQEESCCQDIVDQVPLNFLGNHSDSCYLMGSSPLPWNVTERICSSRGGHLASITERESIEFLRTKLRWIGVYWLGGRYGNTSGAWSDGEEFKYQRWYKGMLSVADGLIKA